MFVVLLGNGGGGGGRIAVYIGQRSVFHGRIQAVGGRGGDHGGHPGSPGTVFIETANVHRQLHIDGADFGTETKCDYSSDLTTDNTVHTISDVYLTHRACIAVKMVNQFYYFRQKNICYCAIIICDQIQTRNILYCMYHVEKCPMLYFRQGNVSYRPVDLMR